MQQFRSGSEEYYIQLKLRREFGVEFHSPGEIWPGDPSYPLFWQTVQTVLVLAVRTGYQDFVAEVYTSECSLPATTAWQYGKKLTARTYLLPAQRSCSGAPEKALAPPTLHHELYPVLGERGRVSPWKFKRLCAMKTQIFIVIKTMEHHSGLSAV